MSNGTPRRKRMDRRGRLQSAKHWLAAYTGSDVVKGYRKWYGVSTVCAIIELRQLGVTVDEQRLIKAKRTEESTMDRARKRRQQAAENGVFAESDNSFAYIEGYTNWGFSYGVAREELETEDDPF